MHKIPVKLTDRDGGGAKTTSISNEKIVDITRNATRGPMFGDPGPLETLEFWRKISMPQSLGWLSKEGLWTVTADPRKVLA